MSRSPFESIVISTVLCVLVWSANCVAAGEELPEVLYPAFAFHVKGRVVLDQLERHPNHALFRRRYGPTFPPFFLRLNAGFECPVPDEAPFSVEFLVGGGDEYHQFGHVVSTVALESPELEQYYLPRSQVFNKVGGTSQMLWNGGNGFLLPGKDQTTVLSLTGGFHGKVVDIEKCMQAAMTNHQRQLQDSEILLEVFPQRLVSEPLVGHLQKSIVAGMQQRDTEDTQSYAIRKANAEFAKRIVEGICVETARIELRLSNVNPETGQRQLHMTLEPKPNTALAQSLRTLDEKPQQLYVHHPRFDGLHTVMTFGSKPAELNSSVPANLSEVRDSREIILIRGDPFSCLEILSTSSIDGHQVWFHLKVPMDGKQELKPISSQEELEMETFLMTSGHSHFFSASFRINELLTAIYGPGRGARLAVPEDQSVTAVGSIEDGKLCVSFTFPKESDDLIFGVFAFLCDVLVSDEHLGEWRR